MTTRPFPRTSNLALRRARQSLRLSQAQFAEAIRAAGNAIGAPNRCTKRLVQKWETGEHTSCRPDYLRVLQAVTGLSARQLGFHVLPDLSSEGAAGDLAGGGGAARTAVAACAMPGISEYSSDGTVGGSIDRLSHALEHPSVADSRTAEFVEAATERLFDLQQHSPSRLLAPTVERHMATVTALLTAARHEVARRRLMNSAGRTAMLAGWLAFDRGDIPASTKFWDASIGAAEGTADAALLAGSLTCQSYAARRHGDPRGAWQLAYAASKQTPHDPRATAWATARVALYAAELGEKDAALSALKRSLDIGGSLPNPQPGDGGLPWMRCFDLARLMSSTALTAALLEDPNGADYAAKAVEALDPARVKARAVVLAEAALTAAIVGEFELCLDWGSSAATLAREMDVSIAADLLYGVVPIVLPHSDSRAVRKLLPQLTRLTRTADLENESEEQEQEQWKAPAETDTPFSVPGSAEA